MPLERDKTIDTFHLATEFVSISSVCQPYDMRKGNLRGCTGFRGTCYRAANWIHVGQTQGRGRMDREHTEQRTWPSKTSTFIHCVAMCNENVAATTPQDRS